MLIDETILKEIERKHLRYISEVSPGIRRFRNGDKFTYFDPNGVKINNSNTLERIEGLRVPPAWEDVWICPNQHGHLQAFGYDSKGRKQYIYHSSWTEVCQENKFNHLLVFCDNLPKLRAKIKKDLNKKKLDKDKLLATVVWLLENTFIRIGNKEYARDNKSYGLTTLRNKHVRVGRNKVTLEFNGKSGIKHTVEITNPSMVRTIKKCVEIPGYELFQYIDEDHRPRVIDSGEVNEYLQSISKDEISAKDFRTWGATLISANNFYILGPYSSETDLKKKTKETVKKVSSHLRNTPKICQNYYIHPTVFKTYEEQLLIPHFDTHIKTKPKKHREISREENIVIDLLHKFN
jgi:DNA topoisomerase I